MKPIVYISIYSNQIFKAGGQTFVTKGFKNWREKIRLDIHVGGHGSAHNQAR